ncbi:MAG: hypothetical protein WC657_04875 [Candidatus Paceibacterota bacterium]|jgi:hypothetical protein
MAEHFPSNPEHSLNNEAPSSAEKLTLAESARREHEPQHETPKDDIEAIQKRVEAAAKGSKETPVEKSEKPHSEPHFLNRQLKVAAFNRTMVRVRKHLSPPERTLSKVIHKPAVEAISNTAAKTIARPTGILTGGFFALVGSSFVLYMAKHYGFRYNLLLFFVLLVGGYVLGLLLEMIIYLVRRAKHTGPHKHK